MSWPFLTKIGGKVASLIGLRDNDMDIMRDETWERTSQEKTLGHQRRSRLCEERRDLRRMKQKEQKNTEKLTTGFRRR